MAVELSGRRYAVLGLVALALVSAMTARLWFLQVMEGASFEQAATGNRTRQIYTEAPRGRIFDAEGRLLAGRRESLSVLLDWTELRDLEEEERLAVFEEVADELNDEGIKTKTEALDRRFRAARNGSLKEVIIAEDVGEHVWVSIAERDLPGFSVARRWIRTYPYGPIGAHIIGYTGTVADGAKAEELNAINDAKRYFPGDELGLSGIESLFEDTLRGVPRIERVEIDAHNRIIGTVEVLQEEVPGADIHLTIDIDYQYAAEQILADELRLARQRPACKGCAPHVGEAGSMVALDVTDGSVVALASYPSFDPSDFIFGISAEQFAYLRDRPDEPLFDRSTQGQYPPGSTYKPITAYAALTSGARGEYTIWDDEGSHTIENCSDSELAGCVFRNAGDVALGPVDLRRAMELSSDTYFYSLGETFWVEQGRFGQTVIQDTAALFGFGTSTGVQLPNEKSGRNPTPENRKEEFGTDRGWYTGDNVNLSIGQGDTLATPLQLTNMYATLATGGIRYEPRLIDHTSSGAHEGSADEVIQEFKPRLAAEVDLEPGALAAIEDGLVAAVATGTASDAFAGFPLDRYPIAGKTGTAQVVPKADYSLFGGYGPVGRERFAVSAVLEESGFGGDAAAPAVRRFFEILAGFEDVPEAPLAGEEGVTPERPDIEAAGADLGSGSGAGEDDDGAGSGSTDGGASEADGSSDSGSTSGTGGSSEPADGGSDDAGSPDSGPSSTSVPEEESSTTAEPGGGTSPTSSGGPATTPPPSTAPSVTSGPGEPEPEEPSG